jgi:hypothetical protein
MLVDFIANKLFFMLKEPLESPYRYLPNEKVLFIARELFNARAKGEICSMRASVNSSLLILPTVTWVYITGKYPPPPLGEGEYQPMSFGGKNMKR